MVTRFGPTRYGRMLAGCVLAVLVAGTSACGVRTVAGTAAAEGAAAATVEPAASGATAAVGALPPGPVTVVAVGDSLTAGQGDETGSGWVGILTENIATKPGRAGSTLVNLGVSGWTSTDIINGADGSPGQLGQAVTEVRRVAATGGAVLATVLVGSNDLWHVYQDGDVDPSPASAEDAAVAAYRTNLDRTVSELRAAGAAVVVGLPDDQSVRPGYADIDRLHQQLANITSEEVRQMAKLSARLVGVAQEVAAAHGAPTVATDGPYWTDPARMDPDGIHPNRAGYTEMAAQWEKVVDPLVS